MTVDERLRTAAEDARQIVQGVLAPPFQPTRHVGFALGAGVAGLLLVVSLVWLVAAGAEDQVVDEPVSTTTVTTLPSDPNVGVLVPGEPGSWSVETSLGTWTWTRVDAAEIQADMREARILFLGGRYYLVDGSGSWWLSEDGVDWTASSVPEQFVGARFFAGPWLPTQVGDELWVVADPGGSETRFRLVGEEWVAVDVPDAHLPEIEGMRWERSGWVRYAVDGAHVLGLTDSYGGVDWEPLYGRRLETIWDEVSGTVDLMEGYEVVDTLAVTILDAPLAIEFRGVESSEVVLRLDMTDTSVTAEQALSGSVWSMYVDNGSGFSEVEVPWKDGPHADVVDLASLNGQFVLIAADDPWDKPADEGPHIWRSGDGLTWEYLGTARLPAGLTSHLGNMPPESGSRLFLSGDQGGLWTSTDGAEWTFIGGEEFGPNPIHPSVPIKEIDGGWLMEASRSLSSGSEFATYWISGDGLTWEQVPMSLSLGVSDGEWGWFDIVGGRVFFADDPFITVGGLEK